MLQVSALASAGGAENLIVLERAKHRPHEVGSVRWAGSTFGPMQKSRLGEHEFEALMRMLDNLVSALRASGRRPSIPSTHPEKTTCRTQHRSAPQGYRTGYTYRYPFVQEKSKPKSDVLIPATVTAFVFEEEAMPTPALRQHAQKQQKEKTRWLNTPNTYLRVSVAEEQQGGQKTKTTVWGCSLGSLGFFWLRPVAPGGGGIVGKREVGDARSVGSTKNGCAERARRGRPAVRNASCAHLLCLYLPHSAFRSKSPPARSALLGFPFPAARLAPSLLCAGCVCSPAFISWSHAFIGLSSCHAVHSSGFALPVPYIYWGLLSSIKFSSPSMPCI